MSKLAAIAIAAGDAVDEASIGLASRACGGADGAIDAVGKLGG